MSDTAFNWVNVTTWALHDWKRALSVYQDAYADARGDDHKIGPARSQLDRARADYRRRVLTWFRKLCLPLRAGECIPNEVSILLAEAWELGEMKELGFE